VCFRYAFATDVDELNVRLAIELQVRGLAVPSAARIDGKLGLHVNVMNHRTTAADLDATIDAALAIGAEIKRAGRSQT